MGGLSTALAGMRKGDALSPVQEGEKGLTAPLTDPFEGEGNS